MLINMADHDFDAIRATAAVLTEAANDWLASIDASAFKTACSRNECKMFFDGLSASDASKREIFAHLLNNMTGKNASLKLDFGVAGSIWFDADVPNSDKSPPASRRVRVGLVPPGCDRFPGNDSIAPRPNFIFGILCLEDMSV